MGFFRPGQLACWDAAALDRQDARASRDLKWPLRPGRPPQQDLAPGTFTAPGRQRPAVRRKGQRPHLAPVPLQHGDPLHDGGVLDGTGGAMAGDNTSASSGAGGLTCNQARFVFWVDLGVAWFSTNGSPNTADELKKIQGNWGPWVRRWAITRTPAAQEVYG